MDYRQVGKSGLKVSVVGVGCNNFGGTIDLETSRKVIHKAMDLGITLFDTADTYGNRGGSEETMGQIFGAKRNDVVLATKFSMPMDDTGNKKGTSRRYVMSAIDASLRRLKTDWIDLYQIHFPDESTPIEETLRALDDIVRAGKVRYIGCCNFAGWQLMDAQWTSRSLGLNSFISCQDEYSLLVRGIERELIPAIKAQGLGLLPYFPLASGLLTGKYKRNTAMPADGRLVKQQRWADRFLTDANWALVERLEQFCAARGHTLLELAFSWLAQQQAVCSVIAGATGPTQIEQNVRAASWTLTAEELAEIDRLRTAA